MRRRFLSRILNLDLAQGEDAEGIRDLKDNADVGAILGRFIRTIGVNVGGNAIQFHFKNLEEAGHPAKVRQENREGLKADCIAIFDSRNALLSYAHLLLRLMIRCLGHGLAAFWNGACAVNQHRVGAR
jgi:hypothetical protein